ncbi:hypothetical protein QUF90_24790 [Desulfococcaceae bacterium HSG9]|nr:hypothetical protein [Desulfococcaceae bacterium HSG9]
MKNAMLLFSIKGLLRDRSRSLFPILMVSAGAFLCVCLHSSMKGTVTDMVDSAARFDTGHVKIMTRVYNELADQMPNDLALMGVGNLLEKLKRKHPDMIWTPRIKFGGLLDIPDENGLTRTQGPVFGIGVDMSARHSPDTKILNLEKALVRGRMPGHKTEILISDSFARKLDLKIGETATLLGSTMYGATTTYNFKVAGTVRFGMTPLDRSTMIADIDDVRMALDMADSAGEIMGYTNDMLYDDKRMTGIADAFNRDFADPDDEFEPVMQSLGEQGMMRDLLRLVNVMVAIVVSIFVFAMSVVLWNAGLMNGIRRYGEIGVRLAMGESKGGLYRSMIVESVCIGIAGSALGTAAGLAVSYWLQQNGIDFSSMMQKSAILRSSVWRAQVTSVSYYIGFLPGVFASVIGTMFAGIGIYRRQTSQLFRELEV